MQLSHRGHDTRGAISAVLQDRPFLKLYGFLSVQQSHSEKGSTLTGKNLLLHGTNSFLLGLTVFEKGDENIFYKLSPLNMYQS